jgi:hypothetical protein
MGSMRKLLRSKSSEDFAARFARASAVIRATPLTAKKIDTTAIDIETGGLEPDPKLKGLFGGNCNRQACQKPGAVYYNHSTRLYYCPNCAHTLNSVNADWAPKRYGHNLCTYGKPIEYETV